MKIALVISLGLFFFTTVIEAAVHTVRPGRSIQKAINRAKPGDRIEVFPGEYRESLVIDKENIKLVGRIIDGKWPILDGEGKRNDAVIASGSGFHIENFYLQKYKGNGVMTQGANRVVIRHIIVANTGIYGIYPTRGTNILVEDTVSWGISDAAIYIGMCDYVDVRRNEVFKNVAGIEIENSHHVVVEENLAHNNAGGILVFTLPGLPVKDGSDVIVRNNFIINNNHENFGAEGSLVGNVPSGSGLVVLAGDKVRIENNIIRDNKSGGIIFSDLSYLSDATTSDPAVDPNFDDNQVLNNLFFRNGYSPDPKVRLLLVATKFRFSGGDILASGKGRRNCIASGVKAKTIGLESFKKCPSGASTSDVRSMYARKSNRKRKKMGPGETVHANVCSGCHLQTLRGIGPPVTEIIKKYKGNPKGIVNYALNPKPVRKGFPQMPSQKYLGEKKLRAVADYFLSLN